MTEPRGGVRAFHQVDVFSPRPFSGNPLAVVADADDLPVERMAALARWFNLSETAFLFRPITPEADYRVRIFTPLRELPFAGHPTLGSCHVWLAAGAVPQRAEIVQECGIGLVRIRRDGGRLAFAAPPLLRDGAPEPELLERVIRGLGVPRRAVVAARWIDNGSGYLALLLDSRASVLALRPDYAVLDGQRVGVVGPTTDAGADARFEVRAFTAGGYEDPVTGSLHAGLARWLAADGIAPPEYVAAQGTALGRTGRVHVRREQDAFWIGGAVTTCISGTIVS